MTVNQSKSETPSTNTTADNAEKKEVKNEVDAVVPADAAFSDPTKKVEVSKKDAAKVSEVKKDEDEEDDDDKVLKKLLKDSEIDIERKVDRRLDEREDRKQKSEVAWTGFYKENPELKRVPHLVELVKSQVLAEDLKNGKTLSWKDGSEIVAKRVKALVESIRSDKYEALDTDSASESAVISSSGSPTPTQVKKTATKGFLDQMKAHRVR
jgi:hypothetical protein